MTEQMHASLRELQRVDTEIDQANSQMGEFDPLLETLEQSANDLESDAEKARGRLKELRLNERRLELSADKKRVRLKMLQDRLTGVRNLREEAAVRAELDLVRRSVEGDEQEALAHLDQIRRLEAELEDLEKRVAASREEVEPRRQELLRERAQTEDLLASLQSQRDSCASVIGDSERRIYEGLRSGGRGTVVSSLTADGACGSCFSMVPLQMQSEVRAGAILLRCEACGVIVAPPDEA